MATDGSDTAMRAVDHALGLAEKFNSKLIIVHMIQLIAPPQLISVFSDTLENERENARILLEEAQLRAKQRGIDSAAKLVEDQMLIFR